MAEPFLSEIRIMSFGFAPKGWAQCNGQLMPINQNQALFSLLGTTYGGDGRVNFALPNLRGQVPIHVGSGFTLGEKGGQTAHTITTQEMSAHTHTLQATKTPVNSTTLSADMFGPASGGIYGNPSSLTNILPSTISNVGGGQAHNNMQPYLTLNFCIALQGIFPSPT